MSKLIGVIGSYITSADRLQKLEQCVESALGNQMNPVDTMIIGVSFSASEPSVAATLLAGVEQITTHSNSS